MMKDKVVTRTLTGALAVLCLSTSIVAQAAGGYYKFKDPITGEWTFSTVKKRVVAGDTGTEALQSGMALPDRGRGAGISGTWDSTANTEDMKWQGSSVNHRAEDAASGRKLQGEITGDRDLRWNIKQ